MTCTAPSRSTDASIRTVSAANVGKRSSPAVRRAVSELYQSLVGKTEMLAWGLDLSKRPYEMIGESFGKGLLYGGLVLAPRRCSTSCSSGWWPRVPPSPPRCRPPSRS